MAKQITVGAKHQIVIPKEVRQKVEGIRPGNKVTIYPLDKETIAVKIPKDNWVRRTYGLMKEAWKDIDPIAELEKMRNEWHKEK